MSAMTPRERLRAVTHFRKPDVLPWIEEITDSSTFEWIKQKGLPAHEVFEMSPGTLTWGLLLHGPTFVGLNTSRHFGCMAFGGCPAPIDLGPIPRFKEKILGIEGDYVDYLTSTGVVARRLDPNKYTWYSMPMFLEYPVKDRKSWEEYKKLLNPSDPRRYPKDWHRDDYVETFEGYLDGPTVLYITGFYGFGAQLMGIESFVTMFYRDPELMQDMSEYWAYFTIETVRDVVETLKNRIDQVFWWEDLSSRQGPNVSPTIFARFFARHYGRVTGFLKKNGIDRIMMDSDGNPEKLLPQLIEQGISGWWPLEVNAGMNAVEARKKYGDRLFLMGNLDKREIAKGGEAMRREVDSKVPLLKELGGYVPGMDHVVPPGLAYDKFNEYVEYLKKHL